MKEIFLLDYLINPEKRTFWIYLISSITIAMIYLYFNKRYIKVNISKALWLHPSAKLDYYYFFFSYFIKIAMIFPIVISAKTVALFIKKQLFLEFGFKQINSLSYEMIVLFYTITLFILSDFTRYWLHRLLHTIPFLWEFHKIHHSAKVLNPLTFYRVHPVENILFGFRYSLSIGFTTGIFLYFFGSKISTYEIIGANAFVFIFSFLGSNLRHSHIPISYFSFLEKWFISPKQHQIHHSRNFFNKNYGGYLAIWDRIFSTIKLSKEVQVLKFGLKKEQMKEYQSIKNLMLVPFLNILRKRRT